MPEKPIHHDEDNQWISGRLKLFRKRKGMTQTERAEAVGDAKYQKHISFYENGRNHMPVTLLFDIIEQLQVSPTEILPPRLYQEHGSVFDDYLRLDENHQEMIRGLIHDLLKAEGKE